MSDNRPRDDSGRYTPAFTDQDVLLVFDYETQGEGPGARLTTKEIADGLNTHRGITVTTEAVRQRLSDMADDELVDRKDFGASAVGWRALVAPAVSDETAERLDDREETPDEEFTTL
jgi:hypothetical protein